MQVNIRQLKKWIAALDSGEYKQSQCVLQDDSGYCCLGVGCEVIIPHNLLSLDFRGQISGRMPEEQPAAPFWLRNINLDFERKTGETLTHLNDNNAYTFPEIATLLELVYIHKMLE